MRTSLFTGLGVLALVLASTAAPAADQPPLSPTRDVAVTYSATDAQGTQKVVHMNFDAAGERLHIDVVGQPGFLVIDRKANTLLAVQYMQHMYIQETLPPQAGTLMERSPAMHLTRGANASVAGLSCTIWSVPTGPKSANGDACITGDGVVLKAWPDGRGKGPATLEATSVVYGHQSESLFVPPAGFTRFVPPTPGATAPPGAPPAPPAAAPAPAPAPAKP